MQFRSEPIVMLPVKYFYYSIAFRLGTHSFQQLSPLLNFSGITYSPPFHDLLGPLKELKKLSVLSSVLCPSCCLDKVKLYCSSESFTSCPRCFFAQRTYHSCTPIDLVRLGGCHAHLDWRMPCILLFVFLSPTWMWKSDFSSPQVHQDFLCYLSSSPYPPLTTGGLRQ